MANLTVNTTTSSPSVDNPNEYTPVKVPGGVLYSHVSPGWNNEWYSWGVGITLITEKRYKEIEKYFNVGYRIIDELIKGNEKLKEKLSPGCFYVKKIPKFDNFIQQFKYYMNGDISSFRSIGYNPSEIKNISIRLINSSGEKISPKYKFKVEEFCDKVVPEIIKSLVLEYPKIPTKYYDEKHRDRDEKYIDPIIKAYPTLFDLLNEKYRELVISISHVEKSGDTTVWLDFGSRQREPLLEDKLRLIVANTLQRIKQQRPSLIRKIVDFFFGH